MHANNYGSELQCFATKKYLESIGYSCDLIDVEYLGIDKVKNKIKHLFTSGYYAIRYKGYLSNRKALIRDAKVSLSSRTKESQFELELFEKASLQPKRVDSRLLKNQDFLDQYEYFIVGSDQVWSGGSVANGFKFLDFAPPEKRIALCPSFGMDKLKNFNEKSFKKYISQYIYLSAREDTGVKIIEELTGRTVPRLADPINLLSKDEWKSFSAGGCKPNEKYIFIHFLDKPNEVAIQTINSVAEKMGLKKICFATPHDEYSGLGDFTVISGNPMDYVSLIGNAEFVCSDSFHTTSFAILLSKRFLVFERSYVHGNKQSTRILNLINIYSCSDRYIKDYNSVTDDLLSATPVFDETIDAERERLRNYLSDALSHSKGESIAINPRLKPIDECTGCMACVSICPKQAISIGSSKFGYRLPIVNQDLCVGCGMCERVCHNDSRRDQVARTPTAYIAYGNESEFTLKSASGGIFANLAKAFIAGGGYVCASKMEFNNGIPNIYHTIVDSYNGLQTLLGSKYVESNCKDVYAPVSELLKEGKRVLFCGTSCQVQGLYSYLAMQRVDSSKLYTIDLICHGVPGIELFKDFISSLNAKNNGECISFAFRRKYDGSVHYEEEATFAVGAETKNVVIPQGESCYYDMFMHYESYREACYHCEYATIDKPADITIGDYFEAKRDYPELFAEGGALCNQPYLNSVIVHGKKGQELIALYGNTVALVEVEPKVVQKSHRQLCMPGNYSHYRFEASEKYQTGGIDALNRMYEKTFKRRKVINRLSSLAGKALHH